MTDTGQQPERVEVTQADRDAAANYIGWQPNPKNYLSNAAPDIRRFERLSEAFARHRLTALTEAGRVGVGDGWRCDVENAPRDGSWIVVRGHLFGDVPDTVKWMDDGWWDGSTGLLRKPPREWFSLAAAPTPPVQERYAERIGTYAAPGDQQQDAWLLRFCDQDMREAIWTGPEAEAQAWEAWNRYAPAWNCYVFRLATLKPVQATPRLMWRGCGEG